MKKSNLEMLKILTNVTITSEKILGKRKRCYTCRGEAYKHTWEHKAPSREEAYAGVVADVGFVGFQCALVTDTMGLFPTGYESWYLRFGHGGGMLFSATGFNAARDRIASSYADNELVQTFLKEGHIIEATKCEWL